MAFSSVARASLRYRIARALLMASQIPTQQNEDSSSGKRLVPGRPPARRLEGRRFKAPSAPQSRRAKIKITNLECATQNGGTPNAQR